MRSRSVISSAPITATVLAASMAVVAPLANATDAANDAPKSTSRDTAPAAHDETLRSEIESALAAAGIPVASVNIDVRGGLVTLRGEVARHLDRVNAAAAVSDVEGVVELHNRLRVGGANVSDSTVAARVERALVLDSATEEYRIEAEVTGGVVHLTGEVDSPLEREHVERIAGAVDGVRDIANQIRVRAPMLRNDGALIRDVRERLRFDTRVDDERITVTAAHGTVVLGGAVDSLADRSAVVAHAYAAGARSVDDGELVVMPRDAPPDEPRTAIAEPDDDAMTSALRAALAADPHTKDQDIEATVLGGVAVLEGTADDASAQRAAVDHARRIVGVLDVDDQVVVDDRAVLRSLLPTDLELHAALRRALDQVPGVVPGQLAIDVRDRRARISGPVESGRERVLALAAARRVYGVDGIVDDLRVTAPRASAADDAQLARAIRRQLFWSPYVDADEVRVEVQDGVAELTGNVGTWRERDIAAENALQAGAIAVDNELFTDMRRWRPAR